MSDPESKAQALGDNPKLLEKYIRSQVRLLNQPYRDLFRHGATFNMEGRYLESALGRYRLQWRIRPRQDEPVSDTNQQTSVGSTVLVVVHPDPNIPPSL
jgi:hypothetical protein